MTGRLRNLADQATPGLGQSWWSTNAEPDNLRMSLTDDDARLIALAPEMARLLSDMAETISRDWSEAGCLDPECPCSAGKISALLARFRQLEERA